MKKKILISFNGFSNRITIVVIDCCSKSAELTESKKTTKIFTGEWSVIMAGILYRMKKLVRLLLEMGLI